MTSHDSSAQMTAKEREGALPEAALRASGRQTRRRQRLVPLALLAANLASCGSSPKAHAPSAASQPTKPPATTSTTSGGQTTSTRAVTSTAVPVPPPTAQPASAAVCRPGDPLANVYHPYRLQVQSACMTVTGTVSYTRSEDDGDIHINLSLPASESHLLDQANYNYEHGNLVAEIVPADQPGCQAGQAPALPATAYRSSSYNYGTCTGADIATPPIGSQVRISGPYVLDSDHGWMEIHPVWSVTVLQAPSSPPATNASPPPTPATQPAQSNLGGTAAWCQATDAPSNDGYPGDYEVYVHSNQPDTKATASDPGDTWSTYTNSSGYADIRLYHTSPGMAIAVTVGGASCSTTA